MKTGVLSLLIVVVIAAVSVHAVDQSRILGTKRAGDKLLDREKAQKSAIKNQSTVHFYTYPKFGFGGAISCIKVLDKWLNGTNGDLALTSGGIGVRVVNLSIRSQVGYGLDYDIEVWGR